MWHHLNNGAGNTAVFEVTATQGATQWAQGRPPTSSSVFVNWKPHPLPSNFDWQHLPVCSVPVFPLTHTVQA